MKYFLIAGEASGDLHASNLMKGIMRSDPDARFRYMGGNMMAQTAGELVLHYRETSYMMLDVLLHLGRILKAMRRVKEEIRSWRPDVVIPVDFPSFNLKMARFSSGLGTRVFYFITPKVWAWKSRRVKHLKKYTGRLFVILPFEVEFFRRHGMEVEYFGNPIVDSIGDFRERFAGPAEWRRDRGWEERPLVALLPGSRKKEIEAMLPSMVGLAALHRDFRFVVAGAPSIRPEFYGRFLKGSDVGIVYDSSYELMASSRAGLVTSGTATLEAALLGMPQAVLYRTGPLAYTIAKRLIKVNFISLVNLICGREVVKEIIQKDLGRRSEEELSKILGDPDHDSRIKEGYAELQQAAGEPGVCNRIAGRMVELLKLEVE